VSKSTQNLNGESKLTKAGEVKREFCARWKGEKETGNQNLKEKRDGLQKEKEFTRNFKNERAYYLRRKKKKKTVVGNTSGCWCNINTKCQGGAMKVFPGGGGEKEKGQVVKKR